jgi:hypothetical protein
MDLLISSVEHKHTFCTFIIVGSRRRPDAALHKRQAWFNSRMFSLAPTSAPIQRAVNLAKMHAGVAGKHNDLDDVGTR